MVGPQNIDTDSLVRSDWLKIGVGLLFLQYAVLAALLVLLRIDLYVALTAAVIVSVLSALAITVYVFSVHTP